MRKNNSKIKHSEVALIQRLFETGEEMRKLFNAGYSEEQIWRYKGQCPTCKKVSYTDEPGTRRYCHLCFESVGRQPETFIIYQKNTACVR